MAGHTSSSGGGFPSARGVPLFFRIVIRSFHLSLIVLHA